MTLRPLILEFPVDWNVKKDIALQLDSRTVIKDVFKVFLLVAIGVAEGEGKKAKEPLAKSLECFERWRRRLDGCWETRERGIVLESFRF